MLAAVAIITAVVDASAQYSAASIGCTAVQMRDRLRPSSYRYPGFPLVTNVLDIDVMRRALKETVFGSELSSLSQDESTECPNIVLKLVTELFKPGRNQELQQLYSVKPSAAEVDALCVEIDSVATSNLRLDKYSSAVVDDALKRVFHRAQQPIIPLSVADEIDRIGEGLNSVFANQQLAKMPKVPVM